MKTTLQELFTDAYMEAVRIPWKVYGTKTHRLLTPDYGAMTTNNLDDLEVSSCSKKNGYWRIDVIDG